MNTKVAEAIALLDSLKDGLPVSGVTSIICPPFVSLHAAKGKLSGTNIGLGAQDMHSAESGSFTGEVSVTMVADLCSYVLLGHSERRHLFGEDDEKVGSKVLSALHADLTPIICVGETFKEREAGRAGEIVERQLNSAFAGVDNGGKTIVAYEPVWAIGTGRAASRRDAGEMGTLIRQVLTARYGVAIGSEIPILYGGSVTADNVADFVSEANVDGALVGGASLDAEGFIRLTENAVASS